MIASLKWFAFICTLIVAAISQPKSDACDKFIDELLDELMSQNLTKPSIPTIIYSGVTPNNPGQMKECKDVNYSYYLIYASN